MKQGALEGFLKKYRDVSRTIMTTKLELFVALVVAFSRKLTLQRTPTSVLWES